MKYLFITPRFPYPLTKGDKLRIYYFIKYLSKAGHTIDLISFTEKKSENGYIAELNKYCRNVHTVHLPKWQSVLKMILLFFNFKPFQVNFYNSRKMKNQIISQCKKNDYDKTIVVLLRMADYCAIKDIEVGNTVIDHIDALSLNMERRLAKEKNYFTKVLLSYEVKAIKHWEKKFSQYPSIVTSPRDRRNLSYYKRISVIPNGVETFDQANCDSVEKDIDLIFVGNMSYFPNVQAIQYFMTHTFDELKKKKPDIKFYIVGIRPGRNIKKYHDGINVFVTGYVKDTSVYLLRSKVFVAPLQSGSGIQNKILEAMAQKVPVVTTEYGNFGIKATDGKEIMIAPNGADFAEKIMETLNNNERSAEISTNAHALIKNKFSWEKIVKQLS